MAATGRVRVPFDTGAGGQTINKELGNLDLSTAEWVGALLSCSKADTDAADTLDVYLQARSPSGIWNDRIHFTQITGDLSPTAAAPKEYHANLQQAGTLSDDEEESQLSGSSGTRLAAGNVLNGPFPGMYHDPTTGVRGASWRVQLVVVDGDSDGDFEGDVWLTLNESV